MMATLLVGIVCCLFDAAVLLGNARSGLGCV